MAGLFGSVRRGLAQANQPGGFVDRLNMFGAQMQDIGGSGGRGGRALGVQQQIAFREQQAAAQRALQDQIAMEDRLRAALSPADGPNGSGTGAAPTIDQQVAALDEARLLNPEVADRFAPVVAARRMQAMTQDMPIEQRLAIELNPERAGQSFATQFEDMPLASGSVRTRGGQAIVGANRAERFDDRWGFYNPMTNEAGYSEPRGATRGENLDISKLQQADRHFYDNLKLEQDRIEAQRGSTARDTETGLRKEFASLPDVKAFNEVASSYASMQSAARNPTAAGDLSMIFAYMKMLDPGSVVREAEFANAQNAAGVPDQIRNMYNRVRSGERLNPDQRQDFLGQAGELFASRQQRFDQLYQEYQGLAETYGASPNRVTGSNERPVGREQPQGGIVTVSGPDEAKRLPRGTRFRTPDGRVLVRQ